jgi:hypothetical protein
MVANYPMGPIFDGGGLNITVMSYLDHLDFGLVACSDLIPDVWELSDGLGEALDELMKAADAKGAAPKPATNRASKATRSTTKARAPRQASAKPATKG